MKAFWPSLIVAVGTALDLATKVWARAILEPYGPATEFLPFIALRLTFNRGISFSLLSFEGEAARLVLPLATAVLTVFVALWAFRAKGADRIAACFVLAGAFSNVIDRVVHGAVTDYLDLHLGDWHLFVFNLADLWITIGACLLLFIRYFEPISDPIASGNHKSGPSSSNI